MKKYREDLKFALKLLPVLILAALSLLALNLKTAGLMNLELPMSTGAMAAIMLVQGTVLPFVLCFAGRILSRKTGIWKDTVYVPRQVWITAALGAVTAAVLVYGDLLIFNPFLPKEKLEAMGALQVQPPFLLQLSGELLYGGVVEEILMRLFFMSLLSWILWKVFARKAEAAPVSVVVAANLLSSLLFALGHLPATAAVLGLSPMMVVRCLVLNGAAGLGFGWLYRKYGFAYGVGAHMLCHVVKHILLAFL